MKLAASFFVPGVPEPQGSKTLIPSGRLPSGADPRSSGPVWWCNGGWMRVVLKEGKGEGHRRFVKWRTRVEAKTRLLWAGRAPLTALWVEVEFAFPRLKSHYFQRKSGPVLRPDAPIHHTTRPDADKLERALGDAFEAAGLCEQDSRIIGWSSNKRYGAQPGAQIAIYVPQRQEP